LRERPLPWPIRWDELRADFISWSERVARHSEEHRASMIRYLDRHLSSREIRTVEDLKLILAECERGRGHLQRGLRNLFKFLEWSGWPEEALEPLRRIVKIDRTRVDNEVPDESEVLESLKAIHSYVAGEHRGRHTKAELAYWALYNVLLDSGARLRHAIEVFNGWDERRLKACNSFYIYVLNKAEGTKAQPYVFLTPYTVELVRAAKSQLDGAPLSEKGALADMLEPDGPHLGPRQHVGMDEGIRAYAESPLRHASRGQVFPPLKGSNTTSSGELNSSMRLATKPGWKASM